MNNQSFWRGVYRTNPPTKWDWWFRRNRRLSYHPVNWENTVIYESLNVALANFGLQRHSGYFQRPCHGNPPILQHLHWWGTKWEPPWISFQELATTWWHGTCYGGDRGNGDASCQPCCRVAGQMEHLWWTAPDVPETTAESLGQQRQPWSSSSVPPALHPLREGRLRTGRCLWLLPPPASSLCNPKQTPAA